MIRCVLALSPAPPHCYLLPAHLVSPSWVRSDRVAFEPLGPFSFERSWATNDSPSTPEWVRPWTPEGALA